ncbi:MAG: acyltransferase family protein [Dysgonomonas sp.]
MERNLRIDYFRIALSLLVITPHAQPLFSEDSLIGWLISNGIARIAVPCFFIISGYFLYLKINNTKALKKYLLHILIVYLVWSVIYLPTYYSTIEPRSLITFALMGYYHLWFLPALIVGILLLLIFKKFIKSTHYLLAIGIILYLTGYVMENSGYPYRSFYNGIFMGYPFIVSGYYLKNKNIADKINKRHAYVIVLFTLTALLIESYLGFKSEVYHNIFLSLYIICPLLFICILKSAELVTTRYYIGKLASGIYYIHILVLSAIIPLSETHNIYKLPAIAAISILLSIFIIIINKRIRIFL